MDPQVQGFTYNTQRSSRGLLPIVTKPDPVPASKPAADSDSLKFDRETMAYVLEDVRLSTLQRKLVRESGSVKQMALAVQISECVMYVDNRAYVRRSSDVICDAIAEIFYSSKHGEKIKTESAEALARVAFVLAEMNGTGLDSRPTNKDSFFKLYSWIWKSYREAKRESIQVYFLKSISAFLKLKPLYMTDDELQKILSDVKENLEKTESSSIMTALADTFVVTSAWKPKLFEPHFQNIVDILIGWHIDSSQNPSVRSYVSQVLLSWHSFWILDMEFSSNLLCSFMEDLEAFTQDVAKAKEASEMAVCCERILSLIQVFNAVLSCLRSMSRDRTNVVSFLPPESSTWCATILNCLLTALDKRFDEDMIVAGQHAFLMLLERIESLTQTHQTELTNFLSATLRNFDNFSYEGMSHVLRFARKLFLSVGSNSKQLQREIVQQLLGPTTTGSGLVRRSALTRNSKVWEASTDFFRHLLNSKDILVLQEVYGHFMSLYQMVMIEFGDIQPFQNSSIPIKKKGKNLEQSEQIIYFILECLSNLIVGKGSVLSMWALDPSIFVVLTRHSGLLTRKMMNQHPWVHYAIVSTLYTHCSNNGQFLATSNQFPTSTPSPTSEYFGILLETTGSLLEQTDLFPATQQLLVNWAKEIMAEVNKTLNLTDLHLLLLKVPFVKWVFAILRTTYATNQMDIKKHCFAFLRDLVRQLGVACGSYETMIGIWNGILSVAHKELDSSDPELKEIVCLLVAHVPPLLIDPVHFADEDKDRYFVDLANLTIEAKMEFLRQTPVNLRMSDFKLLADSLLSGTMSMSDNDLKHIFEGNFDDRLAYTRLALSNTNFMYLWQNFQLAQSCVNNKLKTGLGKAQETLMAFDKVLRHLATSVTSSSVVSNFRVTDCRRLLGFFDLLEKSFVNAWDGGSLNWSPPTKTIATFFKANRKTCSDWLLRLRPSLIQLAFHIGDFPTVLKHADRALTFLVDKLQAGNLTDQDELQFVQIMTMLAVSFRRLGAPQNLSGLYAWCKEKTGKRLPWLRSLIELASGRLEDGSASFTTTLSNMLEFSSSDPVVIDLLNRELCSAHASLCNSNADYLTLTAKYKSKMTTTNVNRNYSPEYLETLSQFNDGRLQSNVVKDTDFVEMDVNCVGAEESLIRSHRLLLQGGALFQHSYSKLPSWNQSGKLISSVSEAQKQLDTILTLHNLTDSQLQSALILKCVQSELKCLTENQVGDLDRLLKHRKGSHSSSTLLLVKKWGEFFTSYRKNHVSYPRWLFQLNNLHMELVVTARKEKNYNLSRVCLEKAFGTDNFKNYVEKFRFGSTCLSVDKASCLRQSAKLLRLQGDGELGVRILCGIAVNVVTSMNFHNQNNSELLELSSRSLNNMAMWFRSDASLLERLYPDMVSPADDGITIGRVLELTSQQNLPYNEAIADNDVVIYRLLHLAVCQAPMLSKIWNSLANWCLELGEKTLFTSEENKIALADVEEQALAVIFEGRQAPKSVRSLLSQVHLKPSCQGAVETEKLALMKRELTDCHELINAPAEVIESLHHLWQEVQRRIFYFHETAVSAYFKFISLCGDGAEDKIISATLRLLQLTVKHALELQESLQTGLATTPCGRWKSIIPQLFSRLNHPVRTVRNRISELLCRIAEEHPQLVIYPAVVGSMSGVASSDTFSKLLSTNIVDEEKLTNGIGNGEEEDKSPEMQSAHAKIVDAIAKKSSSASESIEHVRHMVIELQRISLLWDELWVGTIQQYGAEINRRVKKMDEEVNRLSVNASLSVTEKKSLAKEKYNIVFKPLLYVFEKVFAITNSPPETPNEKWFGKKYGDFLSNTMQKLRDPPDPTRPQDVWSLLNQFLNQKLQKKNGLKLSEISTSLYNMKKTLVPLPGFVEDSKVGLLIDSFDNLITVLPTKTKPKRIMLTGSDGKKYTYLFKGLEDLHLDERIMQFLMIANKLLQKSGGEYRARHYSVVPLGVRSGLIQWVEGSVPLFGLYKRWQQRQLQQQVDSQNKGGNYQKPSDVFYNKLIPLLRDQGITNLDNRREWPLSVMRQVLTELEAETPNDLLSQEVWFASADPQHLFKLTQNLSRSIAVMSIIGYIIGLGDRHLDNLLIDLMSGEIIHIDYNVCFEKGRNLRIPEHVPCRLTQNIVRLFGLTGVEGVFRLSCEHTLETMRAGRETFLTLLEAFVYDPLVDWTPGVELGLAGTYYQGKNKNVEAAQDKRDIQTEITFSMLSVRVAEIRGAWFDNRTNLVVAVTSVEEALTAWLDQNVNIQQLGGNLARLHTGMSLLKEAEANPSHRLYALQDRYFEHTLTEAAVRSSQAKVAAFIEQHERWLHLHQRAIASLSSNQLGAWNSEIEEVSVKATGGPPTSRIIQDFLEKAGQNALLEELVRTEETFCMAMNKLKGELQACIQMLSHYANVALLYPQSYKSDHRTVCYVKWMTEIAENFTVQTCQDVVSEFNRHFDEISDSRRLKQHNVINVNYQLETWSQELKFDVEKIYGRMFAAGIENSNAVVRKLTQNKMDLQQYLQNEKSESVTRALGALIFHKLADNVASLLTLETASRQLHSGVELSDVNSSLRVVDDVLVQISFASQIINLVDFFGACSSANQSQSVKCFLKVDQVVKQLQTLSGSFFAIIMQEGIKSFQREEPTTLGVAFQLNDMIGSAGISLQELIQELESHAAYLALNEDGPFEASVNVARSLRAKFQTLITTLTLRGNKLSPGEMLVLAFNSLFDNIASAHDDLRTTFRKTWENNLRNASTENITTISECKSLLRNAELRPDLEELADLTTYMTRLLTIKDYLELCARCLACFKSDLSAIGQSFPHSQDMARPVRNFIVEFYRRQLVGMASLTLCLSVVNFAESEVPELLFSQLKDLTKVVVDRRTVYPATKDKVQFLSIELAALCETLEKFSAALAFEQQLEALFASQEINLLQRRSFQWFHENDLPMEALTPVIPIRPQLMTDLRNCVTVMIQSHEELATSQAKFQELHGTVEQRMRWACGANPDLQELFDKYSTAFSIKLDMLKSSTGIMKVVSSTTNTILQHEALRTKTREALNSDSLFMSLVAECQQSASLRETEIQNQPLNEEELSLFSMNPPNPETDMINAKWIRCTEENIASSVKQVQAEIAEEKKKERQVLLALKQSGNDLRQVFMAKQKLMVDVGAILRNIDKSGEYELPEVTNYLKRYRDFSDLISNLVKETSAEELNEEIANSCLTKLERMNEMIFPIYDDLISFASTLKEENLEMFKTKRVAKAGDDDDGVQRGGGETTKEEKNAFAMRVLRRVRTKLEGREPDSLKKSSVAEQVDFVIREATHIDNLALLYEGWTAWI